jgi:hypothetical protein
MGNLLSLYPKIHCLDADTQVHCGFAYRERKLLGQENESCGACAGGMVLGEVLWTHAYLYGITEFPPKVLRNLATAKRQQPSWADENFSVECEVELTNLLDGRTALVAPTGPGTEVRNGIR